MEPFTIGRYRDQSRRNHTKRLRPCIAIVAAFIILIGARSMARSADSPRTQRDDGFTVRVVAGDTLWDIANRVSPDSDPRYTVFLIREANKMATATIVPGQILKIPSAIMVE